MSIPYYLVNLFCTSQSGQVAAQASRDKRCGLLDKYSTLTSSSSPVIIDARTPAPRRGAFTMTHHGVSYFVVLRGVSWKTSAVG